MEQYIPKAALVAEIERRREDYIHEPSKYKAFSRILSFIDTIEVKEVELTWEDLKLLNDISYEVFAEVANGSVDYYQIYPTQQSFLEEVLKRFKEAKEKIGYDKG